MKNLFLWVTGVFLVFSLCGCAIFRALGLEAGGHTDLGVLPSYSGHKAKVTVADFEDKAPKATVEISNGLREMLVGALASDSRFLVTQRQAQGATGQSDSGKQKNRAVELIIAATVSEFEPQSSGGQDGVGGGGGVASGALGGLLGNASNKAHMALDIRILDASTSRVLALMRVNGEAVDSAASLVNGNTKGWELGPGLSEYANTPMEKAIHACIIEAVRYICRAAPSSYYKY